MTSMLDRVAEAICQADEQNGGPPWAYVQSLGKHAISSYYDRARAAVTAMKTIDLQMETAGLHEINEMGWQHNSKVPIMPARRVYLAMIDKALA